jgi:peptide/nickel transport system substrate-binding protein
MGKRFIFFLILGVLIAGCGKTVKDALIFGRGGDSVGLDPALETDGESFKVCDNIYETLVRFQQETTEVEPSLATSWEVSSDGLRWTFHLRQGVTFHDGAPLTASAVVFSLERQFKEDHPFHKVEGAFNYWNDMGMSNIVKEIEAEDDSTVVIRLKERNAPFLSNLAMNFCSIVSPEAVKQWGNDFFKHPSGTGPFRFVEWVKDDRIVLGANPTYWQGKAKVEKLIFRSIPENSVRLLELKKGTIDGMDGVVPDFVTEIRQDPALQLMTQPGMNVGYLAMNTEKPPFSDVRVRRAINHAINKKAIVDNLYQGLAIPAKNPMPPTVWGYNYQIEDYSYDPDRAKKLLEEAGYPNGFQTDLWTMTVPRPYMPQPQKVAEAIQEDLKEVGIVAEIQKMEWGTYLDKVFNGAHSMALLGWIGDNGDPDNFLYTLLDKDAAVKPGQNIAFYKSDDLHDLLIRARRLTNRSDREKLYRKAQEIIHRDAPWVPLTHAENIAVFRRSVTGFYLHPTGKMEFWGVGFINAK